MLRSQIRDCERQARMLEAYVDAQDDHIREMERMMRAASLVPPDRPARPNLSPT